tara:strand:- start:2242 stop:3435 length:1194 start_codon:yes stop_codon:yes gene_type:complete
MLINKITGVKLSSSSSRTRYGIRDDSVMIEIPYGNSISCKFTSNAFKAEPVKYLMKNIQKAKGKKSLLLINAGNANAGTGRQGKNDVEDYCNQISKISSIHKHFIYPFSTGVIGERLDTNKIKRAFEQAYPKLSEKGWHKASKAILTTDTKPKLLSKKIEFQKKTISITGFAKGSGMIKPDFATLLSFVFIDAKIDKRLLNKIHTEALSESFERITVEGDTSPNDSSVLVANGNEINKIKNNTQLERKLRNQIILLFKELADELIKDAEGATKKIKVKVHSAKSLAQAKDVAFTIAHSTLVKTAIFGNDANWGRILAAIGRSSLVNTIEKVSIKLNDAPLVKRGNIDPKHNEKNAHKELKKKNISIEVNLGAGKKSYEVLTSDLSEDYLLINSKYRT